MSTTLRDLVFGFQLTEMQFISREVVEEFDEQPYVQEKEHRVKYVLGRSWKPDKIWGKVKVWLDEARKKDARNVRIRYRNNSGSSQTSEIEIGDESVDNLSFTRTAKISVDDPISQCEESVRSDIIEQMLFKLDEVRQSG